MTNLVFIEHKKVPRDQARAIKEDLKLYAISVALKFPTASISEEQKIKVAKSSVRSLLKQVDLSTKNLGTLIHDEVISNLQTLYFKLKKTMLSSHFLLKPNKGLNKELLEMIKIVRLLRKNHPRKYRRLHKALVKQLNTRQQTIFNIYLKFTPKGKRKRLTYQTVSRMSKIPAGTINHQIKQVVQSLNKIFRSQKVKRGR
jgi:hypothetical protein